MFKAIIKQEVSRSGVGIWLIKDQGNGTYLQAKPAKLELETKHDSFWLGEPTFHIRHEDATALLQSIIDELVNMGIRPNNDRTEGELSATKKHLQDVQKYLDRQMDVVNRLIDVKR
jgi:hypothetical protein